MSKKSEKDVQDTTSEETTGQGIIVRDPQDLRPQSLPLVIILPEGASEAQKAYALTLNAYAYKNPTKWALKKGKLLAQLEARKAWPDPVELAGIKYKNHRISV